MNRASKTGSQDATFFFQKDANRAPEIGSSGRTRYYKDSINLKTQSRKQRDLSRRSIAAFEEGMMKPEYALRRKIMAGLSNQPIVWT